MGMVGRRREMKNNAQNTEKNAIQAREDEGGRSEGARMIVRGSEYVADKKLGLRCKEVANT